jgi:ribosome maturation factor RimP
LIASVTDFSIAAIQELIMTMMSRRHLLSLSLLFFYSASHGWVGQQHSIRRKRAPNPAIVILRPLSSSAAAALSNHQESWRRVPPPRFVAGNTIPTALHAVTPAASSGGGSNSIHQAEGTAKIVQAVASCQIDLDDVTIDWTKSGRIVVTVSSGAVYLSSDEVLSEDDKELLRRSEEEYGPIPDEEEMDEEEDGLEQSDNDDDEVLSIASSVAAFGDDDTNRSSTAATNGPATTTAAAVDTTTTTTADPRGGGGGAVDLSALARAINHALAGTVIAEMYEIEVTTPGASDELSGIMWQSYRGFDVIAEYINPKKKDNPLQTIEGRLVERNDEYTILNLKGRMKKLPNEQVRSVKLPKAKKEPKS